MPDNDVIALLERDHREVESLFSQLESTSDPGQRADLLSEITTELTIHAAAEEKHVYPRLRELSEEGSELRDHAIGEHRDMNEHLAEINQIDPADPRFASVLQQLKESVEHHVEEEEADVFPFLRDKLSDRELTDLADTVQRSKDQKPEPPDSKVEGVPPPE
jgi:hemerythrin superfamily protein